MKIKAGRKELKARPCKLNANLYELYYDNGGELPEKLNGKFTSESAALKAAMQYQAGKDRVETKNNKYNSEELD